MSYFIVFFMIVLPVLEIWVLIKLGGYFGAFGTLLLIIGTAGLGILIAKHQGLGILYNLQSKFSQGKQAIQNKYSHDEYWRRFLFYGSWGNNRPCGNMLNNSSIKKDYN